MRTPAPPRQRLAGDRESIAVMAPPCIELTRQQLRCVRGRCLGTNREVGIELGISEQTVKNYISQALARAGVERFEALLLALGWLQIPEID